MSQISSRQLELLPMKQAVWSGMREFFEQRGFMEIVIPVLNQTVPLEPTIYPFETVWHPTDKNQKLYLSTSPERSLKKYLAAGIDKCYGVGHCFRDLENSGHRHTPEFLMLEWYRTGATYVDIMRDVRELFQVVKLKVDEVMGRNSDSELLFQGKKINLRNWKVWTVSELFERYAGLDLEKVIDDKAMFEVSRVKGYRIEGASWEQLFNQIFLNEIETHFDEQPFFVTEFPARVSPLCRVNQERPFLADRFEVYVGGMEVGNGNNENTDMTLVEESFVLEKLEREKNQQQPQPIDNDFLMSLSRMDRQKKQFSGIGLGFDRLMMLMTDSNEIKEIGCSI